MERCILHGYPPYPPPEKPYTSMALFVDALLLQLRDSSGNAPIQHFDTNGICILVQQACLEKVA